MILKINRCWGIDMVRAKCVVMNPNRKGILGSASRKAILLYADIVRESNFELLEFIDNKLRGDKDESI